MYHVEAQAATLTTRQHLLFVHLHQLVLAAVIYGLKQLILLMETQMCHYFVQEVVHHRLSFLVHILQVLPMDL